MSSEVVYLDFLPGTLAYFRALDRADGQDVKKFVEFSIHHRGCDSSLMYLHDSRNPPASRWVCRRCRFDEGRSKLLFTDLDLEKMPLINLQQQLYLSRTYDIGEFLYKVEYQQGLVNFNTGKAVKKAVSTSGYYYTRLFRYDEYAPYHKKLLEDAILNFRRGPKF